MKPYPLVFQPEMKERVWGGRALEQYGMKLPEGKIGEGWMIADHPNGTTRIASGELAGLGLDEIRERFGPELFGKKSLSFKTKRFPLLVKLLDCDDDLSVQVHPDDQYSKLPAGEPGKTEMWYVLDAKPGAKIIYGLNSEITREQLAAAVAENRIMDCLRVVPVAAGDSFYIPAGTVHALCAGVLVAEIQQNSDTTYRLYDYNRPGLDGKPRELHIEDSLNVIAYEGSGAERRTAELFAAGEWHTLVRSPYFAVEKGKVEGTLTLNAEPDSFTILISVEGAGSLHWDGGRIEMKPGSCLLLPANLNRCSLQGSLTALRCYLP